MVKRYRAYPRTQRIAGDMLGFRCRFEGLDTTVRNTLHLYDYLTPAEVANAGDEELLAMRGFGHGRLAILHRWLAEQEFGGKLLLDLQ